MNQPEAQKPIKTGKNSKVLTILAFYRFMAHNSVFLAPIACEIRVSNAPLKPRKTETPSIFIAVLPKPTEARRIVLFLCPIKIRLIVS